MYTLENNTIHSLVHTMYTNASNINPFSTLMLVCTWYEEPTRWVVELWLDFLKT